MKNNYREANCCQNCIFRISDPYDDNSYCNLNDDFPDVTRNMHTWENKLVMLWADNHHTVDWFTCDDCKI